MKKCLFPLDAYVVSCPTSTKNLEWYLFKGGNYSREETIWGNWKVLTRLINDWKKLLEMITFLFSARNIWSKIKGGALGQPWKQCAHHLLSSLVIIRSKCRKFFLIRLSFDSKPWKKFKILFWSYCSPEGLKLFKTSSLSCSK